MPCRSSSHARPYPDGIGASAGDGQVRLETGDPEAGIGAGGFQGCHHLFRGNDRRVEGDERPDLAGLGFENELARRRQDHVVGGEKDEAFLKKHLADFEYMGSLSYDDALIEADLNGIAPFDTASSAKEEVKEIVARLSAL